MINIHQSVPHGKNQFQWEIIVINIPFFVAIQDFATEPEVDFKIPERYLRAQFMVIQVVSIKTGPINFRYKIKTKGIILFIFAEINVNEWEQVYAKFCSAAMKIKQERVL